MELKKEKYTMDELLELMRYLCSPEGCPWDAEQTHESIRRNMIEEAYEACEAIDLNDKALLCEELGDVLLQVVFHGEIEAKDRGFTFEDIVDGVCRKLIVRHPHIFGAERRSGLSAGEVLEAWEEVKRKTGKKRSGADTLDAVAKSLPSLIRAEKLLSRAEKAGLDVSAVTEDPCGTSETGRELFLAVARARELGTGAEEELGRECDAFAARFRRAEQSIGGFEGKDRDAVLEAWRNSKED